MIPKFQVSTNLGGGGISSPKKITIFLAAWTVRGYQEQVKKEDT